MDYKLRFVKEMTNYPCKSTHRKMVGAILFCVFQFHFLQQFFVLLGA